MEPGPPDAWPLCLDVSVAFVWQSVKQEETPPEQSEDSTLTSHISVKLIQLCVTPTEKNHTEVTVSGEGDSL